ncbi:cytochrome C oxidase subunit I [Chitinivorax sp. PXF-14]|uniref:cytochrome C oxidase subunit I n=1 Tax=Chitinivorax sp. PXF-14 TaxID=3230488 RepID=UPI00346542CD
MADPRPNRRILLILLLVCIAPFAASYLAYYVWKPSQAKTHGDLLQTRPLPAHVLPDVAGRPGGLAAVKGRWVLLMADGGACARRCQDKLYMMRQLRLAQGKELDRIERVWLVADSAPASEPDMAEGVRRWRAADSALLRELPVPAGERVEDYIYVIDPLGNQVLRYSPMHNPTQIIRELTKLLKNNEALG